VNIDLDVCFLFDSAESAFQDGWFESCHSLADAGSGVGYNDLMRTPYILSCRSGPFEATFRRADSFSAMANVII
jgi:hypothetical protein